jgi:GTPase
LKQKKKNPGLIEGSSNNRGLGIQFLKHAERCNTLLFVIDLSLPEPWNDYQMLIDEMEKFSSEMITRKKIIAGNKIDMPEAQENLKILKEKLKDIEIIPISAKTGENVESLLKVLRRLYDEQVEKEDESNALRNR